MAEFSNIPVGVRVFWESQQHATVMAVMLNGWLGEVTRQHEPKPVCLSTHTVIENGKAVKPSASFHVMFSFSPNF